MSEHDEEFDRARQKSQNKFRNAFEAIIEKYSHIDEDDDIVDLATGNIIVDNGRIRNSETIELGDLLRYSDSAGSSSHKDAIRIHESSDVEDELIDRDGTISPELLTNNDIMRRRVGSASESIDLNIVPWRSIHTNNRSYRLSRTAYGTESDEELSLNNESSDNDTSMDTYFTSTIEQYMERLRRGILQPSTLRKVDGNLADYDDSYLEANESDAYSYEEDSDGNIYPAHYGDINSENGHGNDIESSAGAQYGDTIGSYEIPSSPHTMTPVYSDDNWRMHSIRAPSMSASVNTETASIPETSPPPSYGNPSSDALLAKESNLDLKYETDFAKLKQDLYGIRDGINIYDGTHTGFAPNEGSLPSKGAIPELYMHKHPVHGDAASEYSAASTSLAAAAAATKTTTPASLPPPPKPPADESYLHSRHKGYVQSPTPSRHTQWRQIPNSVLRQHPSHSSQTLNRNASGPILLKPRPVAPHVFFESGPDTSVNGTNHSHAALIAEYENADDNASIHSGEDTAPETREPYEYPAEGGAYDQHYHYWQHAFAQSNVYESL